MNSVVHVGYECASLMYMEWAKCNSIFFYHARTLTNLIFHLHKESKEENGITLHRRDVLWAWWISKWYFSWLWRSILAWVGGKSKFSFFVKRYMVTNPHAQNQHASILFAFPNMFTHCLIKTKQYNLSCYLITYIWKYRTWQYSNSSQMLYS